MKVLLSPLGMSPGLLFSALKNVEPNYLVVISSSDGIANLAEVLAAAKYSDKLIVCLVTDPFTFNTDIQQLYAEVLAETELFNDTEWFVNITGGTTALQYYVQRLERQVRELGISTTTIAMVDRRERAEQIADPYVKSDFVVVDVEKNIEKQN